MSTPLIDMTFAIKTFLRPACCRKLIASIRHWYPSASIVVADDSPRRVEYPGSTEVFRLPFNSGISVGRNHMLDQVKTPWICMLDDDFVFTEMTRIDLLLTLAKHVQGIAGGQVRTRGDCSKWFGKLSIQRRQLWCQRDWTLHSFERLAYLRLDLTLNFFVAPTHRLRELRWDDRMKVGEHLDFFLRLKAAEIPVILCPSVTVEHLPIRNRNFQKHRIRIGAARRLTRAKHGFRGRLRWLPDLRPVEELWKANDA